MYIVYILNVFHFINILSARAIMPKTMNDKKTFIRFLRVYDHFPFYITHEPQIKYKYVL